jgi:hypothetical protein
MKDADRACGGMARQFYAALETSAMCCYFGFLVPPLHSGSAPLSICLHQFAAIRTKTTPTRPSVIGTFWNVTALWWACKSLKTWWPGTELNRRRQPFQGCALPPELPGHVPPRRTSLGRTLDAAMTLARLPKDKAAKTESVRGGLIITTTARGAQRRSGERAFPARLPRSVR